jgi:rubredoxin
MTRERRDRVDDPRPAQPRETCEMCQGTGRTAFVLPNLLHEEVTCPNCDAGRRQIRQINTEPTKEGPARLPGAVGGGAQNQWLAA